MDFKPINASAIIDTLLLLLIGTGRQARAGLVPERDRRHGRCDKRPRHRKMLTTASVVAVRLVVFGGLLTKLLHTLRVSLEGGSTVPP